MAIATAITSNTESSDWAGAIRQRRKVLLQRLGLGAAIALIFSPVIGWDVTITWVMGFFIAQALELWAFAPINNGAVDGLKGFRRLAGGVTVMTSAAYFGSLSIPLWIVGGPMGGVCASILLSAGAIHAVTNARRSRGMLTLTVAPHFLYLAGTPILMTVYGASPGFVTAASISVGVFATYCLSTWRHMNEARVAESAARVEAEQKRAEAERIMDGRSAFLAAVGHDLRTPISAILTGAAELERGAHDAGARSQAHLITDAGFMMKALLDNLLDHAKLDAGHMTVEQIDFDLRDLLNQTARLWRGPTRAKGLKFRIEGAAAIPANVRGDPMRIRQVLNNLISNAMKFTTTGSVTLRLKAWADDPGGYALLIEVTDTGPGMTPAQVARLFTPFDQIISGISATHGGSGLGLAISRQLAELMGGKLTGRSRPGEGSQFTLALRLQPGETVGAAPVAALSQESRDAVANALSGRRVSPATPVTTPQSPKTAAPLAGHEAEPMPVATDDAPDDEGDRPMRVLIVDDHDINRRAIQLILQPLGCDIATAADGVAALKICENTAFDLIFMDVRMPEMDGREATRRLRAGGGPNVDVPVIAVTADTAPEDIAACTAAGMNYFVPKPITPQMLLGAITHVMTMGEPEAASGEETVAA